MYKCSMVFVLTEIQVIFFSVLLYFGNVQCSYLGFSLYSLEFVQDHPLLVPILKMYMYSKTITVVILSSLFLFDWQKTRLTT